MKKKKNVKGNQSIAPRVGSPSDESDPNIFSPTLPNMQEPIKRSYNQEPPKEVTKSIPSFIANLFSAATRNSSALPVQSKTTMLFASFFLGGIGLHRLLMGYKNWWMMLVTLGGFGIWSLIDFTRIALGKMTMANGAPLEK
ncbi:MAG TPA: TM2 domain-containing protein [Cytophagaceae bacterium]|jgi:hypothetical protein